MKQVWRAHLPWLLCILVVVLFLTRNLWGTRAWIETHDGIFHLIRQEVFTTAVKDGQFPVRWIPSLDNGFGLPLFNYVYPGPYYLGLPLSLLGISSKWVIKIVEIGLYFLGGVGMYFLFAKRSQFFATFAALIYLTTPYLLLNIFVRGALGEFMAISLIPWTLVACQDMFVRGKLRWYHPLPYFLLFISHNFLSFLFLPVYLFWLWHERKSVKIVLSSLTLSFGLAAFFVLPMTIEQGLLSSVATSNFTYNYRDHFIYPIQLIYSQWGIGHSYAGLQDGFSFALGYSNVVILVFALYYGLVKRRREVLPWLLMTGAIIFFLLPVSQPLWQLITPIQIIQFPWRLLALTTITIPLMAFAVFRSRIVPGLLLVLSLFFAYRYTTPFYFQNNDQLADQFYIHRNQTTTSSRREILPKWGSSTEKWMGDEHVRVETGSAQLSNIAVSPRKITFMATADASGARYRVRRNYFPAWYVQDESGKSYATRPTSDGEIEFEGLSGLHTYTAYVGSTMIESIGNWITLLTAVYLAGFVLRPRFKSYLDSHFDGWDISIALRYLPIVDELKRLVKPSDKILEVGSEIRGITPYYPRRITGLDRGFDYTRRNRYLTPVEGSATKMPFKDHSFDYVISVDCIEHIPPKLRKQAVTEMLRVAKKGIYLTFPVGKQSEDIDRQLDVYFYRRTGEHFTYLTEHVDNGLPDFNFVKGIVIKHGGWRYRAIGNTSNWLWVLLLKMGFSNVQWQTSIYRRLLLLLPILKHANFGPCYRQLYILERQQT